MQLAANLSWMYRSVPWGQRFEEAARDGFTAVEILLPYDQPAPWYAERLIASGLQLVLINTPINDNPTGAGRGGWAAVPGAEAEFRRAFDRARSVASATGCRHIHVMAGQVEGHSARACSKTLQDNLATALALAEQDDLVLTLEALNRVDMPGYHYHLPQQMLAVLGSFDTARLRLQFDFYHCMKESLDLALVLPACAPFIGHVQIAGIDGRHEPDLACHGLLDTVASLPGLGYDGWLGCEYAPRATAREGLHWCAPLRGMGVLS